ncbi:MAG TPA: hypothetical protein VII41_00570 [Steroidobacteraceae bacterium]
MRLLDQIAQSSAPLIVQQDTGVRWRLTSACDFAPRLRSCPLRYLLSDELTRMCTALAFSEGDQLADCLDLLHVPANCLWIEWSQASLRDELLRARPQCHAASFGGAVLRKGALIDAAADGRSGVMRTLWTTSSRPEDPLVAALETHFDLDRRPPPSRCAEALLEGECVSIPDGYQHGLDDILRCVWYRFDDAWLRYYRRQRQSDEARRVTVRLSLASVAHDLPVLLALFLLQAARGGLPQKPCEVARLNRKRLRCAKAALLAHVEIGAPVFSDSAWPDASGGDALRLAPRRHHVRGHLVRRHNIVYWRSPHWRGHVRLGHIERRTVTLRSGAEFNRSSVHAGGG